MGMAASQVNFLGLTGRKADIIRQEQRLANQKMALTRDMQKISKEFNEDLNKKILKWSNNAGASYVDLTYKTLMTPNETNQNNLYLITDDRDRVVLDDKYKKYAEMVSENGRPGGKWEGDTRVNILMELTGLSKEKILAYEVGGSNGSGRITPPNPNPGGDEDFDFDPEIKTIVDMYDRIDFGDYGNKTLSDIYEKQQNSDYEAVLCQKVEEAPSALYTFFEQLKKSASEYGTFAKTFIEACDAVYKNYKNMNFSPDENGNITFDFLGTIDEVVSAYKNRGGVTPWDYNSGNYNPNPDTDPDPSTDVELTAYEKQLIKFYDNMFSTVAENGWVYNYKVNDAEYLNQVFQNNLYTITTVEREKTEDRYGQEVIKNFYETHIASNMEKIFSVNDADARNEALVEYEYKKSLINEKEQRIDLRLQDLKTELSAINQIMQSVDQIKKDNIERTFSIFS